MHMRRRGEPARLSRSWAWGLLCTGVLLYLVLRQPAGEDPCRVAERLELFRDATLPRKVHQQWWPGKTVTGKHAKWHERTKEVLSQYEHILWSLDEMRDLIQSKYGWFLDTFDKYPSDMHRADAARYFILHEHGGVYMDMDYVPTMDFYEYLSTKEPSFLESPFLYNEKVGSALMSSPQRHVFWQTAFQVLQERKDYVNVVRATGPGMLSAAVERYERSGQRVHLLACENFFRIPLGSVGDETNNLIGRYFRSFIGRTRLTKDCGPVDRSKCLFGVHYNTMLFFENGEF